MNQSDTPSIADPEVSTGVHSGKIWRRTDLWRGWLLYAVMLVLLLLLAASLVFWPQVPVGGSENFFLSFPLQSFLVVALFATLSAFGYLLARDLFEPAHRVRDWLMKIHAGELSARLPVQKGNEVIPRLEDDLNTMGEMLESQTKDDSERIGTYMEHVAEKTRFLAMMYDLVTSISTRRGLNELLSSMLRTLDDVLGLDRLIIRKNVGDGHMMRLASRGEFTESESCLFLPWDSPYLQSNEQHSRLVLPMHSQGVLIGVCSLYLHEALFTRRKELSGLFNSVVRHFGMAIEACRTDEEGNRLLVLEERARIGREVHDSLAQTISSLRFQVCALFHHVEKGEYTSLPEELGSLDTMVKSANLEVRELIGHFRAPPVVARTTGLVRSLGDMVQRFRHENPNIRFFFHSSGCETDLPEEHATEVQMIGQEALQNVVKHSEAKNVRVFIRRLASGQRALLIEDDGVGLKQVSTSFGGDVRRHYGMSMMHERAQAIGAKLDISGEPGEGVCVRLEYSLSAVNKSGTRQQWSEKSKRTALTENERH